MDELVKGSGDANDVLAGLEMAAALGPAVNTKEWHQTCGLSDVRVSQAAVDELVDRGLARRMDEGWSFTCTATIDALAQRAKDGCRWRAHHARCAQMLFSLYSKGAAGIAARCAAHMMGAGNYEGALPLLLEAEQEAFERGDYEACDELLDRRDRALDELNVGAQAPERAQSRCRRGRLCFVSGDYEQAQALVEESLHVLREAGWAADCGLAALLRGRSLRAQGQLEAARQSFEEASRHLALAGDVRGLAISRASRGYIDMYEGHHQCARRRFLRAVDTFEALGDEAMVSKLSAFVAQTWLVDDEPERAIQIAQRARAIARDGGDRLSEADAVICMGEIARHLEQWPRARQHYEAAAKLYEATGNRSVHVCRLNLALVEIAAGEHVAARAVLEELEDVISAGFQALLPVLYAGLMTSAAGEEDWDRFDRFESRVYACLERGTRYHPDVADLAEQAAHLAGLADQDRARERALKLAREQLEGLGKQARADELGSQA